MTLKEIQEVHTAIRAAREKGDYGIVACLQVGLMVKALRSVRDEAYQHPLSHHILLAETVLKAVE